MTMRSEFISASSWASAPLRRGASGFIGCTGHVSGLGAFVAVLAPFPVSLSASRADQTLTLHSHTFVVVNHSHCSHTCATGILLVLPDTGLEVFSEQQCNLLGLAVLETPYA